jgi:hypothetical protein
MLTLELSDLSCLESAVAEGIQSCLQLFLGDPPKGSKKNFGLDAYRKWAFLLEDEKSDESWAKKFAPGPRMYAGLTSVYQFTHLWGTGGYGSRAMYADFLDEASAILGKPALKEVAALFRAAVFAWEQVYAALLPDDIPLLGRTRRLLDEKYDLFLDAGAESLPERREIQADLDALHDEMADHFPLDTAGARHLRERIRVAVLAILAAEETAVLALQDTM